MKPGLRQSSLQTGVTIWNYVLDHTSLGRAHQDYFSFARAGMV